LSIRSWSFDCYRFTEANPFRRFFSSLKKGKGTSTGLSNEAKPRENRGFGGGNRGDGGGGNRDFGSRDDRAPRW
jgi:hypothetical protein